MRYCPRCATPLVDREQGGRLRRACPAEGCGYVFYGNPTPVVAAIVERDEHVLLVRNRGWPEGMFGLVAGFLEANEAPSEGARREVHEELGLHTEPAEFVGVYPFFERNELILAYHLRASGEVQLGDELEGYKAIPIHKLRSWPFGTGLALQEWLDRRAVVRR